MLEQYLHIYCNYQQDNWSSLLPLAEFAYNNAPHVTTGISPFFTNKGYHSKLAVHPKWDLASAQAQDYVIDLDKLHQELWCTILEAQKAYQALADVYQKLTPEFPLGSLVYIKVQFFYTMWPSKKLAKFSGPFKVIC